MRSANNLLLQKDWELKAECQWAERVLHEKDEGKKVLLEEIQKLEDATYVYYEQGFDEALPK